MDWLVRIFLDIPSVRLLPTSIFITFTENHDFEPCFSPPSRCLKIAQKLAKMYKKDEAFWYLVDFKNCVFPVINM